MSIKRFRVHEPMAPVEPRIVEDHRDEEHQDPAGPAHPVGRPQRPALKLQEYAARDAAGGDGERLHRLDYLGPGAFLAAPVLLDAALGMAAVDRHHRRALTEIEREMGGVGGYPEKEEEHDPGH